MPRRGNAAGAAPAAKEVEVPTARAASPGQEPESAEAAAPLTPTASSGEVATAPDYCRVVGEGLYMVAVKQYAAFDVLAYDHHGQRRTTGGDAFFIAIRGASRVRARVTDMRDGSYRCEWKPNVSGSYTIAVSLFGNSLPGSPYKLEVDAPFPYAPLCEARGDALSHAVARQSHWFEIRFRDRLGNVAQAVELDVFVQPFREADDFSLEDDDQALGDGSPMEDVPLVGKANAEDMAPTGKDAAPAAKDAAPAGKGKGKRQAEVPVPPVEDEDPVAAGKGKMQQAEIPPMEDEIGPNSSEADALVDVSDPSSDITRRQRTINIQVCGHSPAECFAHLIMEH